MAKIPTEHSEADEIIHDIGEPNRIVKRDSRRSSRYFSLASKTNGEATTNVQIEHLETEQPNHDIGGTHGTAERNSRRSSRYFSFTSKIADESSAKAHTRHSEADETNRDVGKTVSNGKGDSWRSSRYLSFVSNRASVRTFLTAKSRQTIPGHDSTILQDDEPRQVKGMSLMFSDCRTV
jgi:hypothetical protein